MKTEIICTMTLKQWALVPVLHLAALVKDLCDAWIYTWHVKPQADAVTQIDQWIEEEAAARRAWALRMHENGVALRDIEIKIGGETTDKEVPR